MARKTLVELVTVIATFIDNINGEITEAMLRDFFTDLKDSLTHLDDFESHTEATDNPHEVTKAQVGLGNCDDTSDADKPISNATATALADKLEAEDIAEMQIIEPTNLTGTALRFTKTAVYGSFASPVSGNITVDMTGAIPGTRVVMVHNAVAEPTYASQLKKMKASGAYAGSTANYITFTCISATRVIFSIDQEL